MIFKRFDEHPRVRVCVSVCIHACAVTQWTVVAPWILVTIRASNRQVYNWNFFFFMNNQHRAGHKRDTIVSWNEIHMIFYHFFKKKKIKIGTCNIIWVLQCQCSQLNCRSSLIHPMLTYTTDEMNRGLILYWVFLSHEKKQFNGQSVLMHNPRSVH